MIIAETLGFTIDLDTLGFAYKILQQIFVFRCIVIPIIRKSCKGRLEYNLQSVVFFPIFFLLIPCHKDTLLFIYHNLKM